MTLPWDDPDHDALGDFAPERLERRKTPLPPSAVAFAEACGKPEPHTHHFVPRNAGRGQQQLVCDGCGKTEKEVREAAPPVTTYETYVDRYFDLPLHRAGDAATTARCGTCDGGGCLDCTDPA